MATAALSKPELFMRLAAGHAAGITVVTPNRRLAQVLKAEFDRFQAGKGLAVWEDADILPLEAFILRGYEDALYADASKELPMLLSEAQSRALWEEAIRASRWSGALLDVPQTAASAQRAWQTAQEWRIAGALEKFDGTEDTRAFADWARAYQRRLQKDGLVDASLLWDFEFRKPELLVAYAFDIVPEQVKIFLNQFEFLDCSPEKRQGHAVKTSFASPREELESAARWARARLEEGKKHIGVVVPDLKLRRREVARVFGRVMGSPPPFELSIGEPLTGYPLVEFALSLLEFCHFESGFETVSRLIRSPFLGGAEAGMAARARLDVRLRREADAEISLPKLIGLVGENLDLRPVFESLFGKSKEGKPLSPHDWARHFTALLDAAGFPGDRPLDSAEYQARAKLNELLAEFARVGAVKEKFSASEAVAHLRRLCSEALFQPEGVGGTGAPVKVLGLLESAGIEFDALWVSGLTDGVWPQHAHPDPFLPVALQRKAGIPQASAEASLALDRRRTEGWLGAADQVVFSWARREEDRELAPSPLIAQVPEGAVELPRFASYRDVLFSSRALESFEDERADPPASKAVKGGTRVLADQAACPFRAFARHRLAAEALDAPEPGLDAMQRGQLLHALMAGIWRELKTRGGLDGDVSAVISRSAEKAVKDLEIEGRFAELEKQRLVRLARDWLEIERGRPPFEVVQIEQKRTLEVGGLSFSGRIDRMDRLLEGEMRGTHAIIDYKTGSRVTSSDWQGPRPDDPQLPMYAITATEDLSALAFAKLRAGDMKFSGFSLNEKEIPGVRAAKNWGGLVATWKAELESLASGFAAGDARVDPKRGLTTCRNCDLQPLCRVHERLSALGEEEGEE
ncbi:MAG TPA: PD-(D/E)XK nuclease family protein [Burkholderiales bacterium]|nr:PD-(D/E)XK nuclease family protein [Burkholderiales bacterium]